MAGKTYFGNSSGKADKPEKIYIGDSNNKARLVRSIYVGDSNGIARKVWPAALLPGDYQRVEYVEFFQATGRIKAPAFIDTGIISTNKTSVFIDVTLTRKYTSFYGTGKRPYFSLMTINPSSVSEQSTIRAYADSAIDADYTKLPSGFNDVGKRLKIQVNNNLDWSKIYLNNTAYDTDWSSQTVPAFTAANNIILGIQANLSVTPLPYGKNTYPYKLHQITIWENKTLVRDFYPCYRKEDNEPGLYDIVNNVFYVNGSDDSQKQVLGIGPERDD